MNTVIDMMIHVNDSAVKPLMEASLARTPGVIEARLKTPKPHRHIDFPSARTVAIHPLGAVGDRNGHRRFKHRLVPDSTQYASPCSPSNRWIQGNHHSVVGSVAFHSHGSPYTVNTICLSASFWAACW